MRGKFPFVLAFILLVLTGLFFLGYLPRSARAKQLIAGHLSIQPETFSRIIRRLIDENIITQDGRQIAILDRLRLEQFE